ncbi:MAG: type II toxin-antitoxin system VapC family toxin [Acidobacteria bacterium]|nr:type II toxin-antitoxin system VapC family toxin [Acidobacteriota bacterium]
MRLLLDTHVWIWSQESPEKLGRLARGLLIGSRNRNCICAISTLEIARLLHHGAISLSMPLEDWVRQSLIELDAETIPVTHEQAIEAYSLPGELHADPADRLLVAAGRCHGMTVLTADNRILDYPHARSQDARR